MRLLSLDFDPVYGEDAVRARFASDISVFDFDVVIWDPRASFQTYLWDTYQPYFRSLPQLGEDNSVRIQSDANRRRNEFAEFINSGRTLVVVADAPRKCYVDNGERRYSGTGRNQKTTTLLDRFELQTAAIPHKGLEFAAASGERIQVLGTGPISRLLAKYRSRFRYNATIKGSVGSVLCQVAGTDRTVGFIQNSAAGGQLVVLPTIDLFATEAEIEQMAHDEDGNEQESEVTAEKESDQDIGSESEESIYSEESVEFQADLIAAIRALSGDLTIARPAWAEKYVTAQQSRLNATVAEQQREVEAARDKLAELEHQRQRAQDKDQLFLGSGRSLELAVREVLELLGGTVNEAEPGRADWRVSFPEGNAVVEVKGVVKSAAEKHAAQLEKWVAAAYEETESPPKGILVVNTWRETPLDERTDLDFPEQMIPYSVSRDHALVTGLQLFAIRAEVEEDSARAAYWRQKLLSSVGRLDDVLDWRNYFQQSEPSSDS